MLPYLPPGLTSGNPKFCTHSVFVWIWEQTAIISLYSINWLVFITETECVYCAVRTGSLYTASLKFSNSTFCTHTVFMCFVWISEQTAIISLHNINWLVFVTETACVYWAVRTGCLIISKPLQLSGKYMYRQFNVQQFYVLPTQCIYLFCVDLRTSSHHFPTQH